MNICFVLDQSSCESSGRPCAWNSNDGFCASSSQAAQTDFFSMIGGIDGLTSHFSCFNFDSDSVACDAEANCAFHNGGCKAAVDASQAALRMVGAPEHYLEFDRLDKLDQMCQGLTADQCSLAKECEVVDGSPTTCARSGGYYIAAAALACEGAPTVSGQWGNWHETASEMLNMSVASAIEFFDYPGYRGCENTCEGRDVNETACGGMDFCDWDAALGRCYSAVGPDLCPIEWASADAFCSSVEASLACRAPSSAANASTCPSVCDWIEGAASDPCSTPSSFRSILDETSSHTQTVFAHFFGCGDFSTQGECDAARGGGSCAWSAGVDECHPAVGAAAEALSDVGAPFAVARFESLSLLAHPDLCFALNDETSCVAEPSCEWIEDEYGSTSCALSEADRLALAADACFGHSDMRRAAFAFGFPGGDASEALEHLPGNATAFPSAASFCPAWSLWMTCGTDRESCESDPECPADQCAPAWGPFEALFAARDAVTSDAIAACGTLARSRDAHSCEATVSPASSSRVSASDVSCAWDASALACEPSGAATYRAVVDSGLAPRAVAEFVRLDVDGVGPCSGLSAVDCDASRACGWDETSRGACGWSFEYYVASAAARARTAPDSGVRSSTLAEAVGVHNVSRARDVAGVERRPPYPGYVGCQLECEGAFVSREVCESKSRAHCAWSAVEGRCESVVGDAPCPEDQPARGWINVTHAVGDRWFDETFWESHHGIIRVDRRNREWAYYRRVDPRDRAFEPYHHVFNNWFQRGNRIDVDFEMYSTYDAALKRDPARRWTHCGGGQESERPGYGFPGECFPSVEAYWEHQDAVAAGTPPPPERRVRVATDSPSYESKGCRLRTAKGEACVTGGFYDSGEAFVETAFPGAFTVYLETPAPPELTRGGAFAPPQDANRATFLAGERELTGAGDLGLGGAERFTVRFKARLADNNAHQNATPGVLVITPADHHARARATMPARSRRLHGSESPSKARTGECYKRPNGNPPDSGAGRRLRLPLHVRVVRVQRRLPRTRTASRARRYVWSRIIPTRGFASANPSVGVRRVPVDASADEPSRHRRVRRERGEVPARVPGRRASARRRRAAVRSPTSCSRTTAIRAGEAVRRRRARRRDAGRRRGGARRRGARAGRRGTRRDSSRGTTRTARRATRGRAASRARPTRKPCSRGTLRRAPRATGADGTAGRRRARTGARTPRAAIRKPSSSRTPSTSASPRSSTSRRGARRTAPSAPPPNARAAPSAGCARSGTREPPACRCGRARPRRRRRRRRCGATARPRRSSRASRTPPRVAKRRTKPRATTPARITAGRGSSRRARARGTRASASRASTGAWRTSRSRALTRRSTRRRRRGRSKRRGTSPSTTR